MRCRTCPFHLACHSGGLCYPGVEVVLCKQCGLLQIGYKPSPSKVTIAEGKVLHLVVKPFFQTLKCEKRNIQEARFGLSYEDKNRIVLDPEGTRENGIAANDWAFDAPGPIVLRDCIECCAHGYFDETLGAIIENLDTGKKREIAPRSPR